MSHQNNSLGSESGRPALDVEELLHADVGSKSGLGHDVTLFADKLQTKQNGRLKTLIFVWILGICPLIKNAFKTELTFNVLDLELSIVFFFSTLFLYFLKEPTKCVRLE